MSSKREELKERTTVPLQSTGGEVTAPTTITTNSLSSWEEQRERVEQQHSINRALDETKDNIRKAAEEARSQIPRYTQTVNDCQEQIIEATREIIDNYLESQNKILNSLQLSTQSWDPYLYQPAQKNILQIYGRIVSSLADNTMAAMRLANNMIFANLEAFKNSMKLARDNTKELSRIGVNAAKTFEQTSRETATSSRQSGGTTNNTQQETKYEEGATGTKK
jgi:hypothetical protein